MIGNDLHPSAPLSWKKEVPGVWNTSVWKLEPNMDQLSLSQPPNRKHILHGFLFFKEHLLLLLAKGNRSGPRIRRDRASYP